jgi:hypothetical protein
MGCYDLHTISCVYIGFFDTLDGRKDLDSKARRWKNKKLNNCINLFYDVPVKSQDVYTIRRTIN